MDSTKTDLLLKYVETDTKAKEVLSQLTDDADFIYSLVYRLTKAYLDEDTGPNQESCVDIIMEASVYDSIKRLSSNIVRMMVQLKTQMEIRRDLDPLLKKTS